MAPPDVHVITCHVISKETLEILDLISALYSKMCHLGVFLPKI